MTSTILSRNKTSFNLFCFTVKKNLGLIILSTVFLLLLCPGYILVEIANYDMGSSFYSYPIEINETITEISVILTVIISIIAVFSCFINFSYLYSKKSVDVYHALPLTRAKLLLSRFSASVVPLLLPIILCYGSLMGLSLLPNVVGDNKIILVAMVFSAVIMVMSAAFSLIFMICAGRISEFIVSFLVINAGLIFSVLIVLQLCVEYLSGYGFGTGVSETKVLTHISPFIYAVYKQYLAVEAVMENQKMWGAVIALLIIIGITVISLAVSVILYNRRKSEKSGDTYAFRAVYYICGIIVGFVLAYVLGICFSIGEYGVVFWVFAVMGAILGNVTLGAITDKGFKTVKKSIIIGAISAGIFGLCALGLKFDVIGYTSRIPDASSVENVQVHIQGEEINANIEQAVEFHEQLFEMNVQNDSYEVDYVYFNYTLKNGKQLTRTFFYEQNNVPDLLLEIYLGDERWEQTKKKLERYNNFDVYIYGENYDENIQLSGEEINELIDIYSVEAKKYITEESFIDYDKSYACINIDATNWHGEYEYLYFVFDESYENTIKFLNEKMLYISE